MTNMNHPSDIVVVIPSGPSLAHVAAGSGAVAYLSDDGMYTVDYEGALYATSPSVYADRVARAADRAATRYPTVARRHQIPSDHFVTIGHIDSHVGQIILDGPTATDLLSQWLDSPADLTAELTMAGYDYEIRRWARHATPEQRFALRHAPASIRRALTGDVR